MKQNRNDLNFRVDYEHGMITSLEIAGRERLTQNGPLFRIRLRDRAGQPTEISSVEASAWEITPEGAQYHFPLVTVTVSLTPENGETVWRVAATPANDQYFVEWVESPTLILPKLECNNPDGTGGQILFPYNEGALICDMDVREETWFRYLTSEYPSRGSNAVFPNMICSQMMAYIWPDAALYLGAHDGKRGVKDLNFYRTEAGIAMRIQIFCGVDFGQTFRTDYPVVFAATEGRWEAAAERYRCWLETELPPNTKKITENPDLPAWYEDSPLVVAYPVRGLHDMDEMKPNKLYPYTNALPLLQDIKENTDSRLLVLLMHWEGTAPWAPPYVWPPFGGVENFNEFKQALHRNGDLLGVYCSGFGYTLQSNLIQSYNKTREYAENGLSRGMCTAPNGEVKISKICTAQRKGHDICPASPVGRDILQEAYTPLLTSGVDYAQILDQNHGGGQYFCYGRDHGHPPAPGPWMTENMQQLLSGWNETAPQMLLGCESAAAEPFIGNLRFSDNRFELNYQIGVPVPLYSYLYHEYLRNFMGNQVSCPLDEEDDRNLLYRLAYAFCAGDSMTLVVDPNGNFRSQWGPITTDHVPNREAILRLVKNLTRFYREQAKPYLYAGRMIPAPAVQCHTVEFQRQDHDRKVILPAVVTTAWEAPNGSRAQILVNPGDRVLSCSVAGKICDLPPLSAVLLPL